MSTQLGVFASAVRERWPDVRHCFLQRTSCSTPERERCELRQEAQHGLSDTSSTTFSSTTSVVETNPKIATPMNSGEDTSCTTTEDHTATASATTCTTIEETITTRRGTSDITIEEPSTTATGRELVLEIGDSGTSSATFSTTTSGPFCLSYDHCKPFLEGPSDGRRHTSSDFWSIEGHYLVRHHRLP